MNQQYSLKLDIACHILPAKYKEVLYKLDTFGPRQRARYDAVPTLFDLDRRLRILDKFEGLMQVLTVNSGAVESISHAQKALDMARLANDELAELVFKHPDRFAAAVACVPINNMDDTLRETDRAITELRFRGVQVSTPINGKSLDSPEFFPLYEKMSRHNLPIWIHPTRPAAFADYKNENSSMHNIYSIFGWPYETTVAMVRLAYSGIFDKYPDLKFITHHGGGMVPYFADRITGIYDLEEMRRKEDFKKKLNKAPLDYLKKFYSDTAIYGNPSALMCAQAFFGSEQLLFGTDFPFDNQLGERYTGKP